MQKFVLAMLGAASIAMAAPSTAQEVPLRNGNFWTVSGIYVDDGHFGDYADHLAGAYRKTQDFAKSKGWLKGSHILANVNKRDGEPDLYLITITDRLTTPAEDEAREKEFNAFLATSARQQDRESGQRAKYRKLGSTMLLQEMLYKK